MWLMGYFRCPVCRAYSAGNKCQYCKNVKRPVPGQRKPWPGITSAAG